MAYALLSLPAMAMLYAVVFGDSVSSDMLHGSGEFSARLMIIALMATPLRLVFANAPWSAWLIRQRRAIGVCAFGYAALHAVFYVIDMALLEDMLAEITALGIWTGWLAFLVFTPLALTSNDWSLRKLGRRWKLLHRTVYIAAVATLVHWVFVHNNAVAAWLHFTPLILLEMFRVYKTARA